MEIKGEFLGFEFDGIRSESLGIVRVSDGDRYEDELHPDIKNISTEVPGMDGEYYFGSTYGPKHISISIAYDSLTNSQLRKIKQLFGRKKQSNLIFDESPYKRYIAKIDNPVELSYVCFDEPLTVEGESRNGVIREGFEEKEIDGEIKIVPKWQQITPIIRDYSKKQSIYKGEGKIEFICYFPFAKSTLKQIPYHYELTQDIEIIEGKKYFIYNDETLLYELVEEPDIEDISSYYERIDDEEVKEWASLGGILSVNEYENFDRYIDLDGTNYGFKIYNPGDVKTGFRLYCPFDDNINYNSLELKYIDNIGTQLYGLKVEDLEKQDSDIGFVIDTDNGLMSGVNMFDIDAAGNCTYTTTGTLYNQYITSGEMFKFEPCDIEDNMQLVITGGNEDIQIFYDYLYF